MKCLLLYSLLLFTIFAQAENGILRLKSYTITMPMPEGWHYALPGPLVSQTSPEVLNPQVPNDVLYEADRQFLQRQDAIDQMYETAGRLDHYVLYHLLTRQELEVVMPLGELEKLHPDSVDPKVPGVPRQYFDQHYDDSVYVMTPNYDIEHRSGPDPIGEGKVKAEVIFSDDMGNVIIAGPEIEGANFRPSVHFGIGAVSEYITDENRTWRNETVDPQTGVRIYSSGAGRTVRPRNTAQLVNLHLARLRKGSGEALVDVENRRTEIIAEKEFLAVTLIWQRGNVQVIQDQFHRKEGNKHWYVEVTSMGDTGREKALAALRALTIRVAGKNP